MCRVRLGVIHYLVSQSDDWHTMTAVYSFCKGYCQQKISRQRVLDELTWLVQQQIVACEVMSNGRKKYKIS